VEAGEKTITRNSLATMAGVAATTIARLARPDEKAVTRLSLDLLLRLFLSLIAGLRIC
jgi:hypothetical protein